MEENEIKKLSNDELVQVYRLVLEHIEYLENEKKKIEEGEVASE